MHRERMILAMALVAIALLGTGFAQMQQGHSMTASDAKAPIMLAPDDVRWGDCPPAIPAGAKCAIIEGDLAAPNALFAFRVKIPDGYKIPAHFHPADEHLTVLSGTFNMGYGDKLDTSAGHAMPAGGFMVMPKGKHHFAWSTGETIVQVHAIGPWGITYVNPADDPRNMSSAKESEAE